MRSLHRYLARLVPVMVFGVLFSTAIAAADDGYRPSFRPDELKGPPVGAPNEVLVLGTPHLSGLGEEFKPEMLEPLLDRLANWRPTAIATENLSGLQCDSLRRYPSRYASAIERYCYDPTVAGLATGLDAPAANAEAERLLKNWPATPTPAQRRRLAAVLLAAGEQGSALVQWLRIPLAERKADDNLNEELVEYLNTRIDRRNETNLIAAALAARLGLERLWSVDDHSADGGESDPEDTEGFAKAIMAAWDNLATRERSAADARRREGLRKEGGLMDMYRELNAPEEPMLVYQSDIGAALTESSPQGYGRSYVGSWETRNLRMVANIRNVLARRPGTKLLAIVGASHKGYYEAYLNQMHDVVLVDVDLVLK